MRTDAQLLQDYAAGDNEAFGELFSRHQNLLWSLAFRTCGNKADAEDALHNALIKAMRAAVTFQGNAKVSTWLSRIVVNAAIDLIRAKKNKNHYDLAELELVSSEDVAESVAGNLEVQQLRLALQQLDPEQRAAIVLVDIEQFSVSEAAKILGCPAGTVKSRCSRGRKQLLNLLTVGTESKVDSSNILSINNRRTS